MREVPPDSTLKNSHGSRFDHTEEVDGQKEGVSGEGPDPRTRFNVRVSEMMNVRVQIWSHFVTVNASGCMQGSGFRVEGLLCIIQPLKYFK